jgi:Restriction endonuclease
MPDYDFRVLSPVDFEHLARDVLNADLGLRLQSYPSGRDQGIDLRQMDTDGTVTVVQCKHYVESSWSTFLRAVEKEGKRGKDLAVGRYLFVTSRPLTPVAAGQDPGKADRPAHRPR